MLSCQFLDKQQIRYFLCWTYLSYSQILYINIVHNIETQTNILIELMKPNTSRCVGSMRYKENNTWVILLYATCTCLL